VTPLPADRVLDQFFHECRSKLLDVAAVFDRLGRGGTGGAGADPRAAKLRQAVEVLLGDAPNKAELVQQLLDVLPDVSERPEIVHAYSNLIDEQVTKIDTSAIGSEQEAVDKLASFGITWWQHGSAFYYRNGSLDFSIIIGVLITAILLTFGAPFWFEQLRTLAALRDPRAAAADKRRATEIVKKTGKDEFILVRRAPEQDG